MVSLQEVRYRLAAFRTKRTYLLFLMGQLALAVVIVAVAFSSGSHFRTPAVLLLETLLFLTMAFDL
jgi:hypothetical protein